MQSFFEKITSLFSLMSPASPEREVFVQSALKWSVKGTDYKTGHPDLHQKIAQVFWRGNCWKNDINLLLLLPYTLCIKNLFF